MAASKANQTQPDNRNGLAAVQPKKPVKKVDLQETRLLEILLDIHQAILSTKDLSAIAHLALTHIHSITPDCVASSVVLLDTEQADTQVLAFNLLGAEAAWPGNQPLNLTDLAVDLDQLRQGRTFVVSDLQELENLLPLQEAMLTRGIRSYLTLPLRVSSHLIGLLNLAMAVPYDLDIEKLEELKKISASLAVAVYQARLLEAEQQRRREAEAMRDVMAALASSVDLNQVLEVILRNLGKVVRYDRAALYMQNENAQFQLPDNMGSENRQFPRIFPADDPIIIQLLETKRPLVIEDIKRDSRFASWPERELVRGWMGVPLLAGEEMIGIVSLGDLEPGTYRLTDANVVQLFTGQVADVLYRARLQENSSRRAEELELLTSFSFAVRQAESRENVLAALMEQTTRAFGASQGTFLLLEKDGSALVVNFSQNQGLVGQWHAHDSDLLWQAVRTAEAIFIADFETSKEQFTLPIYKLLFHEMRSAVLLPLKSPIESNHSPADDQPMISSARNDPVYGVLCFTFQQHQDFSIEDRRVFHAIGDIAGAALRRSAVLENLEKQVNTRTRQLSTLFEISAVASEPDTLEILIERILELTLDVMECSVGAIHLLDDSHKFLNLAARYNIPQEILPAYTVLPLSVSFWRNLISSSEPIIVPDLKVDARVPFDLRLSSYPAFLAAPIRTKGQSQGLLSILSESILDYTLEDITLFTAIAEQIGSIVERARLQKQAERAAVAEERQRLARELHDSISQLLYSLVLYAGAGRKVLSHGDLKFAEDYLQRIDQTSQQALKEMRLLVYELRPSVFREEGLVGAMNRRLQAVEKRTGMNAQLEFEGEIAFDEAIELALYRITEEALNNTLKHAEASRVIVTIKAKSGILDLEISDNGKGFVLQDAKMAGGLGLVGIQERVNQLGGHLSIKTAPGAGTTVSVHLEVPE